MGQSYIQQATDGTGKKVDTQITATAQQHRQVVTVGDPSVDAAVSNVFQFHNADNQSLGSSAYGINTGGVAQLLNQAGNLDRQRETGIDSISAVGVQAGASQFAQGFLTTDTTDTKTAGTNTFTPVAMSGTVNGAPWSIQVGTVLTIDTGTNTEVCLVTAVSSTTFTCVTTKTHTAPFNISGYVYNQERDAAGELDGAPGLGANVAIEYEHNSNNTFGYDRGRNLQGKGVGSTTTTATVSSGATTATASATPTGLNPGDPLFFYNTTTGAITETVYMAKNYTSNSTSLIFAAATQVTHTSGTDTGIIWDTYAYTGPGLSGFLPTGIGVEEEAVWDPVSNRFYIERSHTQDGINLQNVISEGLILNNGTGVATGGDRLKGNSGSAYVYEAYQLDSTNDAISAWEKGYTYTRLTASGSVVSGTCLYAGYTVEASTSGTLIAYDNTAASGNTIGGATATTLTVNQINLFSKPIICTTGLYVTIGGTATVNFLTRNVSK